MLIITKEGKAEMNNNSVMWGMGCLVVFLTTSFIAASKVLNVIAWCGWCCVVILGLYILGLILMYGAYKEGREEGRTNLLQLSDLEEDKIYKVTRWFQPAEIGTEVFVFLCELHGITFPNPSFYSPKPKGMLKLCVGDPASVAVNLYGSVEKGDWVVLKQDTYGKWYLAKWLDEAQKVIEEGKATAP